MTKTLSATIAAAFAATALSAAASAAPAAAPAAAMPVGTAAAGEKVFNQCKVCHVAEKGVNRVGPSLWGVVGRKASVVPGYTYSAANKKSGLVWDAKTLFVYLEAPQKLVPGTKMSFAGLKKPQDRADVIAYLKTKA
ncbi:MAG: cytochrome c family protein [Sandarakinorhabdus sp.]|nr:cytochrome c family protein [Sandarakinorhabdus sp.]